MTAATKQLLRFLTCGSVDDGKSTLIGRLLFESQQIFEDQLAALTKDSRRHGTTGADVDLALLVDGLEAERQQGITIDVAYRFFSTPRRAFIVADTPGHEQYTRNMATGASTASLAIILIDARKGVLTQTRRHSHICALLGIRDVVVAINKIDLVDYDRATYERIVADYRHFARGLGLRSIVPIPLSARFGDNVTRRADTTPWYSGPTLLEHLESVDVEHDLSDRPLRFSIQHVNRPSLDFRGFSGAIASGQVAVGDPVLVATTGLTAAVARIVTADGDLPRARAGDAVTLTLDREIDLARGDLLVGPDHRPALSDRLAAHLLWMDQEPLRLGHTYWLRIGDIWTQAVVDAIDHRVDINTQGRAPADQLALNEIGHCQLTLARPVPFDPYADSRATGAFILVDRYSHRTAGAGMITAPLPSAPPSADTAQRAEQRPFVLWLTGRPGAGKTTLALLLERAFKDAGRPTYHLDGDQLRRGLNSDLGFSPADRAENIRRVGELARLFLGADLTVLCSFISPYEADRQRARAIVGPDNLFFEIYIDASVDECARRDPKGLYARARAGELRGLTGVDPSSPYEPPLAPDLHLHTDQEPPQASAARILDHLRARGLLR
jgi:bifunctional enzyme CysN/CysC